MVGGSPALPGTELQLSVNARGRLQSVEEFGDIIVKSGSGSAVSAPCVTLARIELGAADYSVRSKLNKPAGGRHRHPPGTGRQRIADAPTRCAAP